MVRRRFAAPPVVVATAMLLVAGCGGDEGRSGRAAGSTGSTGSGHAAHTGEHHGGSGTARPTVTRQQLLGKQDLPAGARLRDIELAEYVTQNVGLLERIVTEPEQCAGLLKAVYQASGSDKRGLATAARVNDGRGLIVQTVGAADPGGVTALRELAENCPRVRSSVDEQKSRATYRPLDTGRLEAERSYGVVATNRVAGQDANRSVQIAAIRNGLGISLTISGETGTSPVALANRVLAKLG